MKERLLPNEAHLWVVRPEKATAPELLQAYEALLTRDEREKRDRFLFAKEQHQCLVTRALVRSVLSKYADVSPNRWRFVANQHGRPEIAEPRLTPPLTFNLSHTNGLIACLVATDREVGVDVEERQRSAELLGVAHHYFSPFEIAALNSLPRREQADRVITYWTLKESLAKARGVGLAIPLDQCSFDLDDRSDRGIRVFIDARLGDDPDSWQFWILRYGCGHFIAASIRRRDGDTLSLRVRELVPMRDRTVLELQHEQLAGVAVGLSVLNTPSALSANDLRLDARFASLTLPGSDSSILERYDEPHSSTARLDSSPASRPNRAGHGEPRPPAAARDP